MRIGLVGYGYWGRNHARVLSQLGYLSVLVERDPAAQRRFIERYPGIPVEDDVRRALKHADAFVVATPIATHAEFVEFFLNRGVHVLCEKPLCPGSLRAAQLIERAEKLGLVLMVGHTQLFDSGLALVRKRVAAGDLGQLVHMSQVRTSLAYGDRDAGVITDLLPHDVSVMNWMMNQWPYSVQAQATRLDGAMVAVDATFTFRTGLVSTVRSGWIGPKKQRSLCVIGTEKTCTWDSEEGVSVSSHRLTPDKVDAGETLYSWYEHKEPLMAQAQAFVELIQLGLPIKKEGNFALGVVRAVEAAQVSATQGGRCVIIGGPL